jgi:hypothetical protein
MKRIGVVLCLALLLPTALPAFGKAKKQTYVPNVSRNDILESGGYCRGNICVDRGGRQWDCSGGGKCKLISDQ